jgi:hypothetical protein
MFYQSLPKLNSGTGITWYNDFIGQFDPQGVVEIAFKTGKHLTI